MKAKRLLFLVMAICLASGVRAQFYDGPDDIYYYWSEEYNSVMIFNFDGKKAFNLSWDFEKLPEVKKNFLNNPNYYEDRLEALDYNLVFVSSNSSEVVYRWNDSFGVKFIFSKDRQSAKRWHQLSPSYVQEVTYKKVDKSFFKSGRSRKPSSTMHE